MGLTGSVLAFYQELDRWLNPELLAVPVRQGPMLDPFVLRERVEALEPRARVDWVALHREPGEAYVVWTQPKTDPTTGEAYELPFNELLLDPSQERRSGRAPRARSPSPRRTSSRFSIGCT